MSVLDAFMVFEIMFLPIDWVSELFIALGCVFLCALMVFSCFNSVNEPREIVEAAAQSVTCFWLCLLSLFNFCS